MAERDRLGSSGVFKAIVDGARAVKRALSESDHALPPEAEEIGTAIGQAFIANRFADVHAMGAAVLRQSVDAERFAQSWRDAVKDKGPFTGFDVSDAGDIDLAFIPSLEEIPQAQFVAFLEITFSNPTQEDAFSVGAVLLDDAGRVRVGALHAR